MPCPKCTAPNVERRRDTLVRRDDSTVLGKGLGAGTQVEPSGRWPANVALDESQAEALDEQSGDRPGFSSQRDAVDAKEGGSWLGTRKGTSKAGEVREGFND